MLPESMNSPLSPRPESTTSKKCLSSKAKLALGVFLSALTILAAIPLFLLLTANTSSADTTQTQQEFANHEDVLHLGGFEICSWEEIDVQDSVLVNGQSMNFTSDSVIQGTECNTGDVVVLVFSDLEGVHGSIGFTRVTADSPTSSRFDTTETEGHPSYDESEKTRAWAEQWLHDEEKLRAGKDSGRRQLLTPGQIDVHLHLDLDEHMTTTMGDYGAAKYAVELVAVVNRDVYYPLGFNLKVVSINLRDSYVHSSSSTSAYLDVIQAEGRPNNVNLVHSLTTRGLGGGIAYLGGLYSSTYCYGVSGSLRGEFNKWDLVVVAHELGHNFGASHTHEMNPQVDTCGFQCPADASGATIMSYCHQCSGGLNNIDFVFHQEVKDDIMQTYDTRNSLLANRQACLDLSAEFPDVGVPFTLKTNECLNMAGTNPDLCELDSAWVRDTDSGSFQLRALGNSDSCWEADCDVGSLSLADCSGRANQEFEFASGELRSVACAKAVAGSNGLLSLIGNPVVQWCSPDSPTATPAPTEAVPCDNSNNGATDPYGDDCAWYDANPSGCGFYDDTDFRANEMCCSCGGGVNPTLTTAEPVSSEPTIVVTPNPTDVVTPSPTILVTPSPTIVVTPNPTVLVTPNPTTENPTLATQTPTVATETPTSTMNPTMATSSPTVTTEAPSMATPSPTVATTPSPTTATPTVEPPTTETPTMATENPTLATTSSPTTTQAPTLATENPTVAAQCVDSNNGATDPWGDDCAWYEAHPSGCGNYDDNDFFSNTMCCVCGGGRNPDDPVPSTPSPTPQVSQDPVCYIAQCGCGPDFLQSWCNAQTHQLHGWCVQSEQNCLACSGAWCPADVATTTLPPTPAVSTLPPSTPTTDSPTTESPTTASPTTQAPTTSFPTTQVPTTTTELPVLAYEYEDMNLGPKTCRNNERIERLCLGRNSCSMSKCQSYCDENAECMFYFHNQRGRCHLYRSCNRRRRPTTAGVTMMKLFPTTTESTSTTEVSTTPAGDWATGVQLTHFWDCNGMACDAGTLQPWDESKYVASPGYSPQNPDNHGGAVYGERMWLVGAASDSLSALLGEDDPCCGSADVGTGCGKCMLIRVPGALESDWTALVMKKNRCPPWSNGCEAGKIHFDMAIPGYDNLQYSTANVCGLRENTGFASQEDSAVLGSWYNQFENTAAAGASLCSTLPAEFVEGCEIFSAWGWNRGDPEAEYRVVDCPEAFKAHVAAQFNENGVTST